MVNYILINIIALEFTLQVTIMQAGGTTMNYSALNMQLTLFGDYNSLDSSSDVVTKLFERFKDDGFLPNTIQVLQVEQPSNKATVRLRPQLIKTDGGYAINVLPERIDFAISGRENSQIAEQFEFYIGMLQKVMNTFSLDSNRLALTATYQLDVSQEQTSKIKETLLPAFSYYKENMPIESTAHNVTRPLIKISDALSEYYNVNTDVMFKTIEQKDLSQTKVMVRFDINTLQEKNTNRFDENNICNFYRIAYEIIGGIIEDLVSICE